VFSNINDVLSFFELPSDLKLSLYSKLLFYALLKYRIENLKEYYWGWGGFLQRYLLSQLVLLDELLELLGQLHVLLPQLGVVGAVLLHLHLNVAQGHLEVQHGLLPLLLVLPGPLAVFLLRWGGAGDEGARESTSTLMATHDIT